MSTIDLKQDLLSKFSKEKTYLGGFVRNEINSFNFSEYSDSPIQNGCIKRGDIFICRKYKKPRPCVVFKVNKKDKICYFMSLTTSEDCVHNTGIKHNSRFLRDGFYAYTFDVTHLNDVVDNFIGVMEDKKSMKKAFDEVKRFFS